MPDRPANTTSPDPRAPRERPGTDPTPDASHGRSLATLLFRPTGGFKRRCLLWSLVIASALLGIVLALTRTGITRAIVVAQLERSLGLTVDAASAVIEPDGAILIRRAVVRIPGIPGRAGRVLEIEQGRIGVRWTDVLGDGPVVRRIDLDSPTLRLSVETGTGRVNIEALAAALDRSPGPAEIPELVARNAIVEFDEHGPGGTQTLKRLIVDGRLVPDPRGNGYLASVAERVGGGGDEGGIARTPLRASGRVWDGHARFAVGAVDLSDWGPMSMPSDVRDIVEMLGLQGRVARTELSYDSERGVHAKAMLDAVAVNLPFDAEGRYTPGGDLARMHQVSGTLELSGAGVRAELDGILEDLPYRASLDYAGTSLDSPFACELVTEGFELREEPEFVPFAPPEIAEHLDDFSNPTAMVDARVSINRGPARSEGPAPIEVQGYLDISHGRASFQGFPYPFEQMSGVIFFSNDRVTIKLTGTNPTSGARIVADGVIAPPTPEAGVDLEIIAHDVPVDGVLRSALGSRASLLDEILASGVESSASFELGGTARVTIDVQRKPGPDSDWPWTARAEFDRLGIIPDAFPLPMTGFGIGLEIDDLGVRVQDGRFEPVNGGSVDLDFEAGFQTGGGVDAVRIDAQAIGLGLDALTADALVRSLDLFAPEASGAVTRARGSLDPSGRFDAQLRIGAPGPGTPALDLVVTPRDASLIMACDAGATGDPLSVEALSGRVRVRDLSVDADLVGVLHDDRHDAEFAIQAATPGPGGAGPSLTAVLPSFTSELAIEDLLEAFSPQVARDINDLRARFRPDFAGDAVVTLDPERSDGLGVRVEVDRLTHAEFDAPFGRVRIEDASGKLAFEQGRGFEFSELEGSMDPVARSVADAPDAGIGPATSFRLHGTIPLADSMTNVDDGRTRSLDVSLRGLPVDSGAARWAIELAGGEAAVGSLDRGDVRGEVDWRGTVHRYGPDGGWTAAGLIRPRWIGFDNAGSSVRLDGFEGGIGIEPSGEVRIESLSARAGQAVLRVDATLRDDSRTDGSRARSAGNGVWTLRGSASLDGPSLADDARAMLPRPVRAALESIAFDALGPMSIRIEDAALEFGPDGDARAGGFAYDVAGRAEFQDANADVGVSITGAAGSAEFHASSGRTGEQAPEVIVETALDRARVEGVLVTDARATIAQDQDSGTLAVDGIGADCYGGRLGGHAEVRQDVRLSGEPGVRFDARLLSSGVRFAPVLDDLERSKEDGSGIDDRDEQVIPDASRGVLAGELALGGWVGDASSLRGRGAIRVSEGRVLAMPLLMPLLEVSSLQVPGTGRFDLALARFYVRGDVVALSEVLALADTVELYGYGSMLWSTRELDLWFDSRGRRRVPVVGDLLDEFRRGLAVARVSGTLGDPSVRLSPLDSTRELLGRVLGGRPTGDERRLNELRKRAAEQRSVLRDQGRRIRRDSGPIMPIQGLSQGSRSVPSEKDTVPSGPRP